MLHIGNVGMGIGGGLWKQGRCIEDFLMASSTSEFESCPHPNTPGCLFWQNFPRQYVDRCNFDLGNIF